MSNYERLEKLRPLVQAFIKDQLKGKYTQYVSDKFLEELILYKFDKHSHPGSSKTFADRILERSRGEVYRATCFIFESLLEHGCNVIANGHHTAQDFDDFIQQGIQTQNLQ